MVLHPCPRCGNMIPAGVRYCQSCRPAAEAQAAESMERKRAARAKRYMSGYNSRRDPKYLAFYRSKAWRETSNAKLAAAEYHCEANLPGCQHIACEVHHKDPIQSRTGWDKRLEWDNLEALCIACHNRRHDRWRKQGTQSAVNRDGVVDVRKLQRSISRDPVDPGGGSDSGRG